ncbi:MAG: Mut7-C RNAse domain-containing protein [Thermodesulfobacteriota bacterium]|nr:Mut7-C RNAse domain-containing protein [Thermodesulfobacteriota bacterium]
MKPFSRCLRCNTLLNIVLKEKILDRIPPKTKEFYRRNQSPAA